VGTKTWRQSREIIFSFTLLLLFGLLLIFLIGQIQLEVREQVNPLPEFLQISLLEHTMKNGGGCIWRRSRQHPTHERATFNP
jgi:hypothetical protein